MSTEVGKAYVTLIPSARGFASKMQAELAGDVAKAGRAAGDDYSDEFSDQARKGMNGKGKSMFGGLAKMAAGALAGIGIGKFIGGALGEARDAVVVGARTSNVIKSMGNASKISADQVGDLAEKLSNKAAMDDEVIQSGANLLLTFGNIRNEQGKGNDVFNQTTGLMVDMSKAMGTDLKGSATMLGKALNNPTKGMAALTRVGVGFTDQQAKQIKKMQESGDVLGAQKVILGEVKRQFGGAAETMATPAERAEVAWGNFQEAIGTHLLPLVDRVLNKAADWLPIVADFAGSLADKLGPALSDVVGYAKDFFGFLKDNQTTVAVVAGAIAGLVAVTGIHAAVLAVSSGALKTWVLQTKIVTGVTKAWAAVQWLINAAMSANPIGLLVIAIAALVAGIVWVIVKFKLWDKITRALGKAWDWLKEKVAAAWDGIKSGVSRGVGAVVGFVKSLPGKAGAALKSFGSKIGGAISRAWDWVKGLTVRLVTGYIRFYTQLPGRALRAVQALGGMLARFFTGVWDKARDVVSRGVDSVVNFIKGLPGRILRLGASFASAGKSIIGKFVDGLKNAAGIISGIAGNVWDTLRGLLNTAINGINNALEFTINPPGPGQVTVNPPDIPTLARGARVTGATLAIIGEGREAETVLPDSLLRGLLEDTAAAAAGGGGAAHLTITNWREGTGYFRMVADRAVDNDARFRAHRGAMNA